ncbi:hypothetical protein HaLaN_29293 [Haematococcus lacustris]|uniref:Uncharacterized protein n=1 Tax=Haematococcus lacustris TaxID=44745 RepID=A0A6A0ACF5_HAELA|nr:hypothetical protein HaLaN_29293 [Haematococcus lacustris]
MSNPNTNTPPRARHLLLGLWTVGSLPLLKLTLPWDIAQQSRSQRVADSDTSHIRRSTRVMQLLSNARDLSISANHWTFCSRTATCARKQITAARRVSLRRWNVRPTPNAMPAGRAGRLAGLNET